MVVSNMNTKLSTSEQKPIVSWSALFLSVLCCLGFVHVEIKLHNQEEVIKSLAREAMSHGHVIYGQQLSTRQEKAFATFVSWWTGFASDETNEAFTSEDRGHFDDKNRNSSDKMTVDTNSVGAKIILSPKSIYVEEGSNLSFPCSATGQPEPAIRWIKLLGSLSSGRYHVKTDGSFIMSNVSKSDEGIYLCKATNLLNTDTKHAQVTVLPTLRFILVPRSTPTVSVGADVHLLCSVSGVIIVEWRRKGGILPSGHVKYSNGSLLLRSVTKQYSGRYVCTARNRFRTIEATATLVVDILPSCSHIKAADSSSRSQNYVIDPDGARGRAPFTVYCDMSDKSGVGVTVISHNSEARTHVKGCESKGCYSKDVTYTGVYNAQLARLTAVSSNCEQFIKFECNNDVAFLKAKYAWWVSRDGNRMFYWGGATPGSGKCACGMTNSCQGGGVCNCKEGSTTSGWRQDSGLLTDKSTLPVRQLRFGDTGDRREEGYHTLGKLKCYGRA